MSSKNPIVVGTDGSPSAQLAVEKAGELAEALQVEVHVVNSYGSGSTGAWMAASGGLAVAELGTAEQAQEEAQEIVARASEHLKRQGIEARTHVCGGDPAQALMAVAEDEHARMIVVGNRGMNGARRVLGSVPNRVSHHASCAVLIVPTY